MERHCFQPLEGFGFYSTSEKNPQEGFEQRIYVFKRIPLAAMWCVSCMGSGVKTGKPVLMFFTIVPERKRERSICDQGGGGEGGQKWSD